MLRLMPLLCAIAVSDKDALDGNFGDEAEAGVCDVLSPWGAVGCACEPSAIAVEVPVLLCPLSIVARTALKGAACDMVTRWTLLGGTVGDTGVASECMCT